jgi:hypothetical protein
MEKVRVGASARANGRESSCKQIGTGNGSAISRALTAYLFFGGFFAADAEPFALGAAGCSVCSGNFETVMICS